MRKRRQGESWLCPELSSPTHYIHNPKKDLVSDKGLNWANVHHCITWIPNQRLYGQKALMWKVCLKYFLKEIYKCILLFLAFCLIPHKLNVWKLNYTYQFTSQSFWTFNWKRTHKSEKDSVRQRYNKIISNIGGNGVGDQCQQETFHDFFVQVIDIRSLI